MRASTLNRAAAAFRCSAAQALIVSRRMRTSDFDFALPLDLIAQRPEPQRDNSRLLALHRPSGRIEHRRFHELIQFLHPGDVLVLNDSRVIPARLRGVNTRSGGAFEMLLLEENSTNDWWAMLKPGKRARVGTTIQITPRRREPDDGRGDSACDSPHRHCDKIAATILETNGEGHRRLRFEGTRDIHEALEEIGEIPLPPYIRRPRATLVGALVPVAAFPDRAQAASPDPELGTGHEFDRERYQTVFAQTAGSLAAPTAGLHFTARLLDEIRARGVALQFVTLHIGPGTFAPVKTETLEAHRLHEERFEITPSVALAVNRAKAEGRRVIAVGTTSVRVLESASRLLASAPAIPAAGGPSAGKIPNRIVAGTGRTRIFIHPPRDFKIVDGLLTNFHLPCSTLLMLVSAFAAPGEARGRDLVLAAYAEAIRERYRFFSYGDAMLVL